MLLGGIHLPIVKPKSPPVKHLIAPVLLSAALLAMPCHTHAQRSGKKDTSKNTAQQESFRSDKFSALQWRNLGPFRGGRTVAASGVPGDPQTYYFGSVGGGVWKTSDAGLNWRNISDGFFASGSVGAIAVAPSDPNVVYVGMGEHAIRGVMTSQGDGVYKSTDAGRTWTHMGFEASKTIAAIRIHPENPDLLYMAVQGSQWSDSEDRGVYRSADGGSSWKKVLYVDEKTGAADLAMDPSNPRILYAGMWDHRREPWRIRSGGEGSGLHKSTDGGDTWKPIITGLPEVMGKVAVAVSPAHPDRLYANIEAEGEKGGVYRSDNAGKNWQQVCSDRVTVARAWYYIEIFADPQDEETVYVLNAPMLKSIDGGKTFSPISVGHGDTHDLWINPDNPANMILADDGGAEITFNGGQSWSAQNNQPTAQFYRVITDDQFPYHVYGGQQDNTTVCIASKTIFGGITESDWYAVAGGESAFLAFNDPENPTISFGTSIQGMLDVHDKTTGMSKDIMAHPGFHLGKNPEDQTYRFNWNGPLVHNRVDPGILYHGGNILLRSDDGGYSWTEISPDLTRNDPSKHTATGVPFTNEAAGGEVYNTISYIASSSHEKEVIWVGTDDGLVHVTRDEGGSWKNVSPPVNGESLINAIEVSPHDKATAYLAVTRYKFDDLTPMIFVTTDYGETWKSITSGLPQDQFVRVVREDPVRKGLLYAGTENGFFVSFNKGEYWNSFQSNLPVTPVTDLIIKDNDLIAATSGRGFWILDDLSSLQQSGGSPDTTALQLFAPKTTHRFTLGGGFEKGGKVGQNPWPGVSVDYYLPHNISDTASLVLEVLDGEGKVIRTLSNSKAEGFKTWPGGPQPPQIIPSKPGLNRTNWDLGRERLPGVEGVFVLGSLAGSLVGPGTYTLQLKLDDQMVSQKVDVVADPRLKASAADFQLQQEMLVDIETAIREMNLSVIRLRKVKKQLKLKLEMLEEQQDSEALQKAGEEALKAITDWEEKLIQPKQKTFQDVINFENRLIADLNYLRGMIDSYDPKPTMGEIRQKEELTGHWKRLKDEMEDIIQEEIESFNKLDEQLAIPALILPVKE